MSRLKKTALMLRCQKTTLDFILGSTNSHLQSLMCLNKGEVYHAYIFFQEII